MAIYNHFNDAVIKLKCVFVQVIILKLIVSQVGWIETTMAKVHSAQHSVIII